MRTRIWVRSRRPNVSVRGGWPTTLVSVCVYGISMRPLRSWVTCVSCIWRVRSHKPNCWCCTRPWRWSSAWNNKWEVSASLLLHNIQWVCQSFFLLNNKLFLKTAACFGWDENREETTTMSWNKQLLKWQSFKISDWLQLYQKCAEGDNRKTIIIDWKVNRHSRIHKVFSNSFPMN